MEVPTLCRALEHAKYRLTHVPLTLWQRLNVALTNKPSCSFSWNRVMLTRIQNYPKEMNLRIVAEGAGNS